MIPPFITDNLSEDEINLVLSHLVTLKRHGYGEIVVKAEAHQFTGIKDILSENPARFKTMYAGVRKIS